MGIKNPQTIQELEQFIALAEREKKMPAPESEMTNKVLSFSGTPADLICAVMRGTVREPEKLTSRILKALTDARWCFGKTEDFGREVAAAHAKGMEEAQRLNAELSCDDKQWKTIADSFVGKSESPHGIVGYIVARYRNQLEDAILSRIKDQGNG